VIKVIDRSFDFFGRRHISTSGFASTATETAVFALFLPVEIHHNGLPGEGEI